MKVLFVNSYVNAFGGAELSALNLAYGLAGRGHEVHFLAGKASSSTPPPAPVGATVQFHYRTFQRPYPIGVRADVFRKALWHLQDLANPSNTKIFSEVCHLVSPDIIILHAIDGIGLNIWRPIRDQGLPCIQVLHDLAIICLNKSRYRNGRQCRGLCLACRAQKIVRMAWLDGAKNFCLVSPSLAVMKEIEGYVDLSQLRKAIIRNPNSFLVKERNWSNRERARLLYVGRLDPSKGVDQMLRCMHRAHGEAEFDVDILGDGSLEQALRETYSDARWIRFHGRVDQETIAQFMSEATALLVPSLWLENFPGVAVHALFAGLPVVASDIGGLPEIVDDQITGRLVPPTDEEAWTRTIISVVKNKSKIPVWSAACLEAARRFEAERSLDDYERLMHEMVTTSGGSRLRELARSI
jgi:glycosyltransferase involved in cell wall biosynthesis